VRPQSHLFGGLGRQKRISNRRGGGKYLARLRDHWAAERRPSGGTRGNWSRPDLHDHGQLHRSLEQRLAEGDGRDGPSRSALIGEATALVSQSGGWQAFGTVARDNNALFIALLPRSNAHTSAWDSLARVRLCRKGLVGLHRRYLDWPHRRVRRRLSGLSARLKRFKSMPCSIFSCASVMKSAASSPVVIALY